MKKFRVREHMKSPSVVGKILMCSMVISLSSTAQCGRSIECQIISSAHFQSIDLFCKIDMNLSHVTKNCCCREPLVNNKYACIYENSSRARGCGNIEVRDGIIVL